MKKISYIILFLIFSYGCQNDKLPDDFTLEGNWSGLYFDDFDNQYEYQEIFFNEDTFWFYSIDWGLELPSLYKIINDSIYISNIGSDTTISAKIKYRNADYVTFKYDFMDLELTRIKDDGWSVDSLIETGIFFGRDKDSIREVVLQDFIDYQFRIREIESYIFLGHDKKEDLIKYWQSMIDTSDYDDDYFQYLITHFEKN